MQWLVVCGLDGILVGDDGGLKALNTELIKARPQIVLVYLTGRSLTSVMELRQQVPLLPADFIACDGGTSLWRREGERYVPVVAWMNVLNHGWRRSHVRKLAQHYPLQEQPPQHQGPFKLSYYLSPAIAATLLPHIVVAAEEIGAQVMYKDGFLDFLATDKAELIDFLGNQLSITEEHSLMCDEDTPGAQITQLTMKQVLLPTTSLPTFQLKDAYTYCAQQPHGLGVLEGLVYWGVV
jgi:sucrose-6-phosphatase